MEEIISLRLFRFISSMSSFTRPSIWNFAALPPQQLLYLDFFQAKENSLY
jgi:hypothetical protein